MEGWTHRHQLLSRLHGRTQALTLLPLQHQNLVLTYKAIIFL